MDSSFIPFDRSTMPTLSPTARPARRLRLAELAVETFAPLDDAVTPGMRGVPGTSSVCAGQCIDNNSNQNNCKTCHGCNSEGDCSNVVKPGGR
jgi:hypothetical protein